MLKSTTLTGVFAAVVTPLQPDLTPDLEGLDNLLRFLATRGCHGALLMGTTGEGPSFSREERILIFEAAAKTCQSIENFSLLAGTGTPSLEDTLYLTQSAFDLQFDGVVVLPPYYFRNATDAGLFRWFSIILDRAVPDGRSLLGYHIPPMTGMGFSVELLARLRDAYPNKFAGIKDSSGDPAFAKTVGARFGSDLVILNGNDRLFSLALQAGASGCITAVANLLSPLHREIWDNFQSGTTDDLLQEKLSSAREVLDRYPPFPPVIKFLLAHLHDFPHWKVKPPLIEFDPDRREIMLSEFLATLE